MLAGNAADEIEDTTEKAGLGRNVPIRVVDSEGNILDITEIKWSALNGGAVHLHVEAPDE